jgi:ABC-2 type transport system permease protein
MIAHALRALPDVARVSVARHVAYRAEMTIWILTSILPLIMLALWNAVAADGPIAGWGQDEVARYFVATLVCRQLTGSWVVWELAWSIRTGRMSASLLRPLNPITIHAVWMLTALPFRVVILAPVVVALVVWRPDLLAAPAPEAAALFVVSVALAWLLNFLVQVCFGLLAFWIDKVDGLFGVWFAVWSILSGYVAPLAFFPDALAATLRWLPFRATLSTPVELLGGFLPAHAAWPDVAAQAVWCAAAWALAGLLWRRGLGRYAAFGA